MKRWIQSCVFAFTLAAASIVPLSDAEAALNAYLNIKGQKTGAIKGGVTSKGREGLIQIDSVSHEIVSPRDPASGLPTGKRMHKPFVITKRVDKSSPLLNTLLVNNENITSFELTVYTTSPKGAEALTYKVKLVNANVASIRVTTDDQGNLVEQIAFTYQKIEWTWVDGGITAQDDWETPVA